MAEKYKYSASVLSGGFYLCLLAVLVIMSYPLALLPPQLHFFESQWLMLPFGVSLPGSSLLGLAALPVLLLFYWRLSPVLTGAALLFVIMAIINIPAHWEYADGFFNLLSFATIPLATAILYRSGYLTSFLIAGASLGLWVMQLVLSYCSVAIGSEPVGTAGNVNWLAALLLILSPWVVYLLAKGARRFVPGQAVPIFVGIVIWAIPTLPLLYLCNSRAAWLAVLILPFYLILIRIRRISRRLLYTGALAGAVALLAAVVLLFFPHLLLKAVKNDVRQPLWTATGVLIYHNPFGTGVGEFQKNITPLRRVSSYQSRLYAADMTNHPHNELLHVGAQLGLPGLIAFIIMISAICGVGRKRHEDPVRIMAGISGYFVVMAAMFDLVLVQSPTNIIGLTFIGLCWPLSKACEWDGQSNLQFGARFTAAVMAVVLGCFYLSYDLKHDIRFSEGVLLEASANGQTENGDLKRELQQKAIDAYKGSIVPFHQVAPFYKIGRLSLNHTETVEQAWAYLEQVVTIDPNFSHINLLLGQLQLRKGELTRAGEYFERECQFYPRSDRAWQNMFMFSLVTGQYNKSQAIEKLLADIYRTRGQQNYSPEGLIGEGKLLVKTLERDPVRFGEEANRLLDRINADFIDPLLFEIVRGDRGKVKHYSGPVSNWDTNIWRMRQMIHAELVSSFGALPAPVEGLLDWFERSVATDPGNALTHPLQTWLYRRGTLASKYLLFSIVCEINGYRSILELDDDGLVEQIILIAEVFRAGSSGEAAVALQPESALRTETSAVTWYQVNLKARTAARIDNASFKRNFRWQPGKTVVYMVMADYFLRNRIISLLLGDAASFVPKGPPSVRLQEIFSLTGATTPSWPLLSHYCYRQEAMNQKEMLEYLRQSR